MAYFSNAIIPIIVTEQITLHYYIFAVPVNLNGLCRDEENAWQSLGVSDENTLMDCKRKCEENAECVAFSYETPSDSNRWSCMRYKGGPYISGTGSDLHSNIRCYILSGGTFFCFR